MHKTMKVIDIQRLTDYYKHGSPEYEKIFGTSHIFSCYADGNPNGGHYSITVGDREVEDGVWQDTAREFDLDLFYQFLRDEGANDGETILVFHWW